MINRMFGLVVIFLALTDLALAQVVLSLNGPQAVNYCDRFALTNTLSNAGETLSHLVVTQSLPSASYQYVPGQSLVLLDGAPVRTGLAAEPIATNGTTLVWDLTNLVGKVSTDHLLITEVFYNTGGTAPDPSRQWIELFNPTTNAVSLAGWTIKDALPGQTDAVPAVAVSPFGFLIVAASTNAFLADHPGYSGALTEVADGTLGKGLNYFASGISLIDPAGHVVDAMSYGASTAAFSPPCPTVAAGHSLARDPADTDTNTRSDWTDRALPEPGTGRLPLGVPGGSEVTVIFQVDVRCGTVSGEFVASAAFQQPDGGAMNVATGATFVTMLPGSLTVTKTPSLQSAGIGDTVVWTITVRNEGFGKAVNAVVTDTLGSGLAFTGFSVAPTNAAPFGNAVSWDASTFPALASLAPNAQVSLTVTAQVNECAGLWNQADARWGCSAAEPCQDTSPGMTALAGINFIRRPPALTGHVSPAAPVPVDYCAGSPVTITLTNSGAGPARGIRFQPQLPIDFEAVGAAVSNGLIVVGNLAGGQTTNVTFTLRTLEGVCSPPSQPQFGLLLASYSDACGTPFSSPVLPVSFQLTPQPVAVLHASVPRTISGDAGQGTASVLLQYSNFNNTLVTITDLFPAQTNVVATNLTSGGTLRGGTNLTWSATLSGDGVWTGRFDIVLTSGAPCHVPSGVFANRLSASGTDCHACPVPIAGTNTVSYFAFENGASCSTNSGGTGTVSCAFSATAFGPALAEVCEPAQLYAVYTNFAGAALPTNWNGVVFQSDLAGGRGQLASTNAVTVEVNGVDLTAFATVLQTSPVFRLSLSGLSASAVPAPTAGGVVTIGWQVAVTNVGSVADSSSLALPACSGSAHWYWNVGASAMGIVLQPIVNYAGCMPAAVRIDLSNLPGPDASSGTNGLFPSYDVRVVLDLNADGDANSTYTYIPGSTVLSGLTAWRGGALTNFDPVVDGHTLTWSLGDLAASGAGSLLLQLRSGCGQTPGDMVRAAVDYNDLCHAGSPLRVASASSATVAVLPLQFGQLTTYLDPELQPLTGSNITFTIQVQNTGAGPAMNAVTEFSFPTNLSFVSASVPPSGVSATNAVWAFDQLALAVPPGDLADLDGDFHGEAEATYDDLPANGSYAITVTLATHSCGEQAVQARSWSGCGGERCQTSPDASAAFRTVGGALVSSATFPASAAICTTNTALMRIRNASIADAYSVVARLAVPQNGLVIPGSYRYAYGGVTSAVTAASGSGTAADPLVFTSAGVLPFVTLGPKEEVSILCDVFLPCAVSTGSKTFVSSSRMTDACGIVTEIPAVNSTVFINEPQMGLTLEASMDGTNYTAGTLLVEPGDTIRYRLTFQHTLLSRANASAVQLGAVLPSFVQYLGSSLTPDTQTGTNGARLAWQPATVASILPAGVSQPQDPPLSIIVTGRVVGCGPTAYATATLDYGCASDSLCLGANASHPITTLPRFPGPAIASTLTLTPCGGTKTTAYTNLNGAAQGIFVTDTAPSGYVFSGVTVYGSYAGEPHTVTYGGSPTGRTVTVDFTTASALPRNQGFSLSYTLRSDGTTLDHLANPLDLDFADPSPLPPSLKSSPMALVYQDLCGNVYTNSGSVSALNEQPDARVDVQPNSLIVTNGQIVTFTVTTRNLSSLGDAENLHVRVRLGPSWSDLRLVSSNLVQSGTSGFAFEQIGNTNLLVDLPGVVLNTLYDEVVLTLQATATAAPGDLNIVAEVVSECDNAAIPRGTYTNTLGEAALADTMDGAVLHPVNGAYSSFAQDESVVVGFRSGKSVRYPSEPASSAGAWRDARIGESLVFRLTAEFFGNNFGTVRITDSLPPWLVYGTPVDAGSGGGITNWTFDAQTGIFSVLPAPLVNGPSAFAVDIPVLVSNAVANTGLSGAQSVITNEVTTRFAVFGFDQDPATTSAYVRVVEPDLQLTQTATPNSHLQAGMLVVITNVISQAPDALTNAYHLVFTDTLPPGLAYVSMLSGDTGVVAAGNTITVTETNNSALANLTPGGQITLVFQALVTGQLAGATLTNAAQVAYTSLDTVPAGSQPRTGADGLTGLNSYFRAAAATLLDEPVQQVAKYLVASSQTNTVDTLTNSTLTIGERIVYAIRVDVPQGLTTNLVITDHIPAGLVWVGSNSAAGLTFPGAGYAFEVPSGGPVFAQTPAAGLDIATHAEADGRTAVVFSIPGVADAADGVSNNDYLVLKLEFAVLDTGLNAGLLPSFRVATNTVEAVADHCPALTAAALPYDVAEPQLSISKTMAPAVVDAGDMVTVTVVAANSALARANANHVAVLDTLTNTVFDAASVVAMDIPAGWTFVTNGVAGGVTVQCTSDTGVPLPPGQNATCRFRARVAQAVSPNLRVVNAASVTADTLYDTAPTGLTARAYSATAQAGLAIPDLALAKTLFSTSATNAADSVGSNVQIGETVTYRLTVTLPQGTVTDLVVTDAVPAGLSYILGSASVDASGFNGTVGTLVESPSGAAGGLAGDGQPMAFSLAGATVCNGSVGTSNNSFALFLKALVLKVPGNLGLPGLQTVFTNRASMTFTGNPSNAVTSGAVTATAIEPSLAIAKTMAPTSNVDAGDWLTVTLTVTNSGLATAYDVALTDTLNPNWFDVSTAAPSNIPYGLLFTNLNGTVSIYSNPTAAQTNRTLAAGQSLSAIFRVKASVALNPNTTITNAAAVAADTIDGTNTDSTADHQRAVTAVTANAVTALSRNVTAAKTLVGTEISRAGNGAAQAVIGELVTYRLTLTVPEGTTPGVVFQDTLDQGLAYAGNVSLVATSGVTVANNPPTVSVLDPSVGSQVQFTLGDVVNTNSANAGNDQVVITYQAVVLDQNTLPSSPGNQAGITLDNSATFKWGTNAFVSAGSAAAVTIVEPTLSVTKQVAPDSAGVPGAFAATLTAQDAGNPVFYRIMVTNGAAASDTAAFNLEVLDALVNVDNLTVYSVTNRGTVYTNGVAVTGLVALPTNSFTFSGTTLGVTAGRTFAIETNSALVVVIRGTMAYTAAPGSVTTNTATIRWSSMDIVTNRSDWNTSAHARNGGTQVPLQNVNIAQSNQAILDNYAASAAQTTITENTPILLKMVSATSEAHTADIRLLYSFANANFSSIPAQDPGGNPNTWTNVGSIVVQPYALKITGTATERGVGYLNFSSSPLDLRNYYTLGLMMRSLTGNSATPLRLRLMDTDGTICRYDMLASPASGQLTWTYLCMAATVNLLSPTATDTAGSTAGLNLAAISRIDISGDLSGASAAKIELASLFALRTQAVPGEIVRYRLIVELPEGTSPDFSLYESSFPGVFKYLNDGTARVAFLANGAGITSYGFGAGTAAVTNLPAGAALNLVGSDTNVLSVSLLPGSGNGVPIGGLGLYSNNVSTAANAIGTNFTVNAKPYFRLGTLVNNDNDADPEYVILEFNALVANDNNGTLTDGSSVQAGTVLVNAFMAYINTSGTKNQIGGTSTTNDFSNVIIVEPQINNLTVKTLVAPVDAGDPVTYRVTFSNTVDQSNAAYGPTVLVATTNVIAGTFIATAGLGGTGRYLGAPTTVDGVGLQDNDRVLVKNQATTTQNGIYKVVDAANGIWDRATDFDTGAEMPLGYRVRVLSGAANAGQMYALDTSVITINTTAVTFSLVAANPSVRVATTANLTGYTSPDITGVATALDGVTLALGDRVLVKSQTTGTQNGIYVVTNVAAAVVLTRAADYDTGAEAAGGLEIYVAQGTANGGQTFAQQTTGAVTLGTTAVSWIPVAQVAAFDLVLTNALPPGVLFQSVTVTTPDQSTLTLTASGSFTGGSVVVPAVGATGIVAVTLNSLAPVGAISGSVKGVTVDIAGTVTNIVSARAELVDNACLWYTSLPGTGTVGNATGSMPPGGPGTGPGTDLGERNGSGYLSPTNNTLPIYSSATMRNNYAIGGSTLDTLGEPTIDKSFRDGVAGPSSTSVASSFSNLVAVGESVSYDVLVTLPEGVTTNLVIVDAWPAGLRLDSAMVVTNAGLSGASNVSARLTSNFLGQLTPSTPLIAPTLPVTGPANVSFTITNCSTIADNNAANKAFVLRLKGTALNVAGNSAGYVCTNTAYLRYAHPATNSLYVADSNPANDPVVVIVEPVVTLALTGPTGPLDAGDAAVYTLALSNNSAQVAYDVALTNGIPALLAGATILSDTNFVAAGFYQAVAAAATTNALSGATFTAGSFAGAPTALDGVTLTNGACVLVKNQTDASQNGLYLVTDAAGGAWSRLTSYDEASEMTSGYRTRVSGGNQAGQVFVTTNAVATVNTSPQEWLYYASYAAPTPSNFEVAAGSLHVLPSFTLTLPPGASVTLRLAGAVADSLHPGDTISDSAAIWWTSTPGTNGDERTGSGGINTYTVAGQTSFGGLTLTSGEKFLFATDRSETATNDVTIGETVTYALRITLPEGSVTNLTVTDLVPTGTVYTGYALLTSASASSNLLASSFATNLPLPTVTGGTTNGAAVTFAFGTIVNPGNNLAGDNAFLLLVSNRVLNVTGNVGLAPSPSVLTNRAVFALPGSGTALTSSPVIVTVVEPRLGLTKDIVQTLADAGDLMDVVLIATNTGTGAAYDVAVRDPLPPALFAGASVQLGSAGVDYPSGFTAAYDADSNAVVYSSGTVAAGGSARFVFHVPLAAGVLPGTIVTNTAQVAQYTTLSNAVPNERYEPVTQAVDTVTIRTSSVSGFVYGDSNNNGVKNNGEPAITNVTITLCGTNHLGGLVSLTTATTADGSYAFAGLRPGAYTLTETQPTNWIDGSETVGTPFGGAVNNAADSQAIIGLVIPTGASSAGTGYNFGELLPGSLAGRVYVDLNTNGVYNAGELPITNVTVTLTGTDDRGEVSTPSATVTNGTFAFLRLRPGTYALTETQPAGYGDGAEHVGSLGGTVGADTFSGIAVAQGNVGTNYDFGETVARIGDFVWEDQNGNGVQDAGEPGVNNVTVRLLDASSNVVAAVTTDAQGRYAFTNLLSATYLVEFVAPGGMVFTSQDKGANDLTDSDADALTGRTAPFTLAAGSADVSQDAGLYRPAQIGDLTWVDTNANGQKDAGETGLADVVVRLYNASDAVMAVTTSSVAGAYSFANLPPGLYTVAFAPPPGWNFTTSNVGSDASDSDPLAGTNRTAAVTLVSGQTDNTVDAGFYADAALSGYVRVDLNGNGVVEASDINGIAGVTVQLLDASSNVVATTATAEDGSYSFASLRPSVYTVREIDLAGWYSTADISAPNDNRIPVTLVSGQTSTGNTFYDTQRATLGNFVWNDTNGNGQQDSGEPGLANVAVKLYDSNNAVLATTTTDVNGAYAFTNLLTGTYTVGFTPPANYLFTTSNVGDDASDSDPLAGTNRTAAVTLASGQTDNTVDAGFYAAASIAGFVRADQNGNGAVEADDTNGIAGVTVRLQDASANTVATATTSANGSYSFTDLRPGSYTVCETDLSGWYSTTDVSAPNDNQIPVALSIGQNSADNNFYDTQYASLGDFVWLDTNGNGAQDAGEPGLTNVTVFLLNAISNVVATTATGATGTYLFTNLPPATYLVQVVAPTQYVFTVRDTAATNDLADSDVDRVYGRTAPVMLAAGVTDRTVDAGLYVPATLYGNLFVDRNGDLLRDEGDASITNALVRLVVNGVVVASTNTVDQGYYRFDQVPPGAVSVLVSRASATLIDVPRQQPAASNVTRNRALPDAQGVDAYITYTVVSGYGVLANQPGEPLNFGFSSYPLSTAIDFSAYATAGGQVQIELWTVNESGCEDIVVYAWLNNSWTEVGRVPSGQVVGEGSNRYQISASGLETGKSYFFKIVDESGHVHVSPAPITVKALRMTAVRLELDTFLITFNTEEGSLYRVVVSDRLDATPSEWVSEYVSLKKGNEWSDFTSLPFNAGPGSQTTVRVPVNRARAFLKILLVNE